MDPATRDFLEKMQASLQNTIKEERQASVDRHNELVQKLEDHAAKTNELLRCGSAAADLVGAPATPLLGTIHGPGGHRVDMLPGGPPPAATQPPAAPPVTAMDPELAIASVGLVEPSAPAPSIGASPVVVQAAPTDTISAASTTCSTECLSHDAIELTSASTPGAALMSLMTTADVILVLTTAAASGGTFDDKAVKGAASTVTTSSPGSPHSGVSALVSAFIPSTPPYLSLAPVDCSETCFDSIHPCVENATMPMHVDVDLVDSRQLDTGQVALSTSSLACMENIEAEVLSMVYIISYDMGADQRPPWPPPELVLEVHSSGSGGDMDSLSFIEALSNLPFSLVRKATQHCSVTCSLKLSIQWVAASDLADATPAGTPDAYAKAWEILKGCLLWMVWDTVDEQCKSEDSYEHHDSVLTCRHETVLISMWEHQLSAFLLNCHVQISTCSVNSFIYVLPNEFLLQWYPASSALSPDHLFERELCVIVRIVIAVFTSKEATPGIKMQSHDFRIHACAGKIVWHVGLLILNIFNENFSDIEYGSLWYFNMQLNMIWDPGICSPSAFRQLATFSFTYAYRWQLFEHSFTSQYIIDICCQMFLITPDTTHWKYAAFCTWLDERFGLSLYKWYQSVIIFDSALARITVLYVSWSLRYFLLAYVGSTTMTWIQEGFQGGRRAIISLACYTYIAFLAYQDSNSLKVVQALWYTSLCNAALGAKFQEIPLHIQWDPRGSTWCSWLWFSTYYDQESFQGRRNLIAATVWDQWLLGTRLYYRNSDHIGEHRLQWDPGGFFVVSAWGQAEFQGGRDVRTLSYSYTPMGWPFGPRRRADPCGHLQGATCYIDTRRGNEGGIQDGSRQTA